MTSLDLHTLADRYHRGICTPKDVIREVYAKIEGYNDPAVWIYRAPLADALAQAELLDAYDPESLPLYGVPFAIKDNLDWAGIPTTAGCPAFAYTPQQSATVVERLQAAGAILIGKTNLDQFATGLVGTRTPYGVCRNPFDARYIPGGSSAGSAVAVAAGLVSFALGTDTAGSGRVPAGFNNIVGLKPTRGLISTLGLVPAVRTLDCVSIFALTCVDALRVLQVAGIYDPQDPFSRQIAPWGGQEINSLRVGIPQVDQRQFFGNTEAERCYHRALDHLQDLGCTLVPIDFQPFAKVAQLLYEGPWLAERLAALGPFLADHSEAIDPVVLQIIQGAKKYDAVAVYEGLYRLAHLHRETEAQWQKMDLLAVPTTGTIYTVAEVAAEPLALNRNLGTYTNFVNLLDLSAVSVPSGFQSNGLPTGLTLIAGAGQERLLLQLGAQFHAQVGGTLGATGVPLSLETDLPPVTLKEEQIQIVVVGAHLTGQPLNYQLVQEQGVLIRACRTRPAYRLYALTGGAIPKPGLIHQGQAQGYAIEVEVWSLPAAGFGRFVANIPAPLGIGTLELEDGSRVQGFLCESYAVVDALDISTLGGWRAYLSTKKAGP